MLREPAVWLVVERPLVQLVRPLVHTLCWLLLLVEGKRRPGWWKQASVERLRPVCLAGMCLHPPSCGFFFCYPSIFSFFYCHLLI